MASTFQLKHGYTPCVKTFGSSACGWVVGQSAHVDCPKTLVACEARGNLVRFGGFPMQDPEVLAARAASRVASTLERWRAEDGV